MTINKNDLEKGKYVTYTITSRIIDVIYGSTGINGVLVNDDGAEFFVNLENIIKIKK